MQHYFLKLFFILLILCVPFFSWLPSPDLNESSVLPNWLGAWANEYGNLRTAVPFFGIGFLASMLHFVFFKVLRGGFVGLLFVESVQLFLPQRHFDWLDVLFGMLGLVLGYVLAHLFVKKNYAQ